MRGGVQRPFGTFPKINLFCWHHLSFSGAGPLRVIFCQFTQRWKQNTFCKPWGATSCLARSSPTLLAIELVIKWIFQNWLQLIAKLIVFIICHHSIKKLLFEALLDYLDWLFTLLSMSKKFLSEEEGVATEKWKSCDWNLLIHILCQKIEASLFMLWFDVALILSKNWLLFRCASISWFHVVSESAIYLFQIFRQSMIINDNQW